MRGVFHPRLAALLVWTGGLLLIFASAMHPVVVDPRDTGTPIAHVAHSPAMWKMDHALMTVAIVLWTYGLASCCRALSSVKGKGAAGGWFAASMAAWLITLSLELGGFPLAVEQAELRADPSIKDLAACLFSSSLIAGYLAMVPVWLGVVEAAASSYARPFFRKWQRIWGIGGGLLGLAGIACSLVQPSVWVVLVTTAIPFGWTLLLGWKCWRISEPLPGAGAES